MTLQQKRIKLQNEYLNIFKQKHHCGDFYISGGLYCFDDGYYVFDWETICYDIDNNCKAGEPFKWIDWGAENPNCVCNYENWIKLGGSEKSREISKLLDTKRLERINKAQKEIDYFNKILEKELGNELE